MILSLESLFSLPRLFPQRGLRSWIGVRFALGGGGGGSRDVRAGGAFVEIWGDDSALRKALERASKRVTAFGKAIQEVGKVALGGGLLLGVPLAAAVRQFTNFGDALDKMSIRTGVGVEFLSGLAHAADLAGTNLEDVEGFIRKMNKSLFEAGNDGKDARDTLQQLGLSIDNLQAASVEERFLAIADALSKVADSGDRAALMMKVGGRGGTQLADLFGGGRAGILSNLNEARALGATWSKEQTTAARDLNDAFGRVKSSVLGVVREVGFALAPAMLKAAEITMAAILPLGAFVRENQATIITLAGVAAGLVVTGVALTGFGFAVQGVALALKGLSLGVGLIGFLITIPGLATAAAAGLLYLWSTTDSGRNAVSSLSGEWISSFQAMVQEVEGGRLAKAFEILFKTIELSWAKFWGSIRQEADKQVNELTPKSVQESAGPGIPGVLNAAIGGWKMAAALIESQFHEDSKHWLEGRRQDLINEVEGIGKNLHQMNKSGELHGGDEIKRLEAELARMRSEAGILSVVRTVMPIMTSLLFGQAKGGGGVAGILGIAPDAVKGGFQSPDWRQQFGLGDTAGKRMLTATEQTADNTKKLLEVAKNQQPAMWF